MTTIPEIKITHDFERDSKILGIFAGAGALFGVTMYVLSRGIAKATIRDVNTLIKERFEVVET